MKKNIFKKAAVAVCVAALGCSLVFAAGCSSNSSSQSSTDYERVAVNVGYWGGTCEAPLYVAYELGYFDQYGIDANITKITQGSSTWLANNGDDAYSCFEATPNFLPAIANGLDIKYISEVHTGCIQGCATAASGITDVKQLEGKNVGTFDANDMGQIFLSAQMVAEGADPSKVNWVVEGNIGTMLTEAAAGNIVAFANFDPYVEIACEYFGYTKIFNNATADGFKDMTCCFLAANNKLYSDSDVSKRVASAVNDACKYISENPEKAAAIIAGNNTSGTAYVTDSTALLANFGVDSSAITGDIHETLIKSYTWGNTSKDHFTNSLKTQWETVQTAGMMPEGKTIDELVTLCGAYCGL